MADSNPKVTVEHLAGDRLLVRVRDHVFFTDQPWEDGGVDTAPTPTEFFIASLASCVAFYAERFLRRNDLSPAGLEVSAEWMWAERPHRVGPIRLTVEAPGLTPDRELAFRRVIDHCTIHNTLREPPEVEVARLAADAVGMA
jgi:putative redox protein